MTTFFYEPLFQLQPDKTNYTKISSEHVKTSVVNGKEILQIEDQGIKLLIEKAFHDVSHYLRKEHLEKLHSILSDPQASDNDRYVSQNLLENAVIAAEGTFPSCQDTGTAIIMGKKGEQVWTDSQDEASISEGVFNAYQNNNLRFSQTAALTMFEEVNTKTNLPAQIDLYATKGNEYHFLCIAKGGGSANKTYLYQETKALLNEAAIYPFLKDKISSLGTSACPPYHLAIVIGGTSAEANLKTAKLVSTKYYDSLPTSGNEYGRAFRDVEMEDKVLKITQELGIGAQFGGKYFCHDVRIVRLPRHGASCPVGLAVSCSADRNVLAKITKEGLFLETLETNPSQYLPKKVIKINEPVAIDINMGMDKLRQTLSQYPIKTRFSLSGDLIVARDIAHAKLKAKLDQGEDLPKYFKEHIIYYAGPAKTPDGYASGSFGPTTAGRMDAYVAIFQQHQGSMVMLAKGNRSLAVTQACQKNGGFYLGSIGGGAAILAKNSITDMELLAYPELGMEAIYRITVKDFPAFMIVDDKGNDFFEQL